MEWITCENVYDETWRRLLEYANIDLAVEAIELIHGKDKSKSNYKKQATQARAALLQGREYFEAAKVASLFTKPNLLYYGSVALSTACMLLRGDGTKSLDYLRRLPRNAHHGLEFTFSGSSNSSTIDLGLLNNSHIKICPHGHFINWHQTLKKAEGAYALTKIFKQNHFTSNMQKIGETRFISSDEIKYRKESILKIAERLPELSNELSRYGILTRTARYDHNIEVRNDAYKHIFNIHSSPSNSILTEILNQFKSENNVIFCINIEDGLSNGIIHTKEGAEFKFSWPDSRETVDHKSILYGYKIETPEIVDLFTISYALSMLSRYYPDIWITFLESHCKGAKLVERIVDLVFIKTPLLALNQLSATRCVVSNHKPSWH